MVLLFDRGGHCLPRHVVFSVSHQIGDSPQCFLHLQVDRFLLKLEVCLQED